MARGGKAIYLRNKHQLLLESHPPPPLPFRLDDRSSFGRTFSPPTPCHWQHDQSASSLTDPPIDRFSSVVGPHGIENSPLLQGHILSLIIMRSLLNVFRDKSLTTEWQSNIEINIAFRSFTCFNFCIENTRNNKQEWKNHLSRID